MHEEIISNFEDVEIFSADLIHTAPFTYNQRTVDSSSSS